MLKKEILQILKQIFDFSTESEGVILQKLDNLDDAGKEELMRILLDYTTKQNEVLQELNKTLFKGKNEIDEINEDSKWESAEEIIAKI